MITNQYHHDKFGYYTVGDLKFYSKLEAIEYDNQTKYGVKWNFNEDVFNSWDWTQEPEESLTELYHQRAQRIRKNYDYVVVWYSGGADSHNILSSFVNRGIHVDEVAVLQYEEADNPNSYWTTEVKYTALQDIKKLKEIMPNTLFRYVDTTRMIGDLYQGDSRYDWIYHANSALSPNNYLHTYLREFDPHYQEIIASGKKMVFVWGIDKPRIKSDSERFGMYFQDIIDNGVGARTQMLDRPWEHDELFYWSADSIPLLIKQGHCLMRFLKLVQPPHPWLLSQDQHGHLQGSKELGSVVKNGVRYYLTQQGQSAIIYPWWPYDRFQNSKPHGGSVMSARDSWLFKNNHNEHTARMQQRFYNGLEQVAKIAGNQWLNKEYDFDVSNYWFDWNLIKRFRASSGYVGCLSPVYWLEPELNGN